MVLFSFDYQVQLHFRDSCWIEQATWITEVLGYLYVIYANYYTSPEQWLTGTNTSHVVFYVLPVLVNVQSGQEWLPAGDLYLKMESLDLLQ